MATDSIFPTWDAVTQAREAAETTHRGIVEFLPHKHRHLYYTGAYVAPVWCLVGSATQEALQWILCIPRDAHLVACARVELERRQRLEEEA